MAESLNHKSEKPSPPTVPQENPWLEAVKTIVTAGILAFGIRTFVAEADRKSVV